MAFAWRFQPTEADCAEEWAQDYGIEPGDPIHKLTELGQRALEAHESRDREPVEEAHG